MLGTSQVELRGERFQHPDPIRAERGERADRAAELDHQDLLAQTVEAGLLALDRGEPDRAFEAESDRQRLLEVGAPGHRGIAMAARQGGERRSDAGEVGADQIETVPDLEHEPGVDDVLRGGAPVDVAAGVARAGLGERLDQRHDRIAGELGAGADRGEIEARQLRLGADLGRGLGGDQAEARLRPGERRLDLEHALQARLVGEGGAHRGGAEQIAVDCGIDRGNRHGSGSPGLA